MAYQLTFFLPHFSLTCRVSGLRWFDNLKFAQLTFWGIEPAASAAFGQVRFAAFYFLGTTTTAVGLVIV
jgi:hypothetical protein